MIFIFLNGWKEVKTIKFHDTWKAYKFKCQCPYIKFYWNPAVCIYLCIKYVLLMYEAAFMTELRSWVVTTDIIWPAKSKNIYNLTLYGEKKLTSTLDISCSLVGLLDNVLAGTWKALRNLYSPYFQVLDKYCLKMPYLQLPIFLQTMIMSQWLT